MRYFFKILSFVLIVKLIDLAIAYSLDYMHERTFYGEIGGNLNAYLRTKKCDTLFMGASRIQNGIDPDYFGEEAYNLSNQQMHILFQTATLDMLDQEGKLPEKLLVLHIEVEDFSRQFDAAMQSDIHFLRYYYNKNHFVREQINNTSPTEFLKYGFASYRHNKNAIALISNYLQRKDQTIGSRGYYGLESKSLPFDTSAHDLLQVGPETFRPSPLTIKCLKRIKGICAKNRIKLIVLTAPLFRTNREYITLMNGFSTYLRSNGIAYLNYNSKQFNPHFEANVWYDLKHLNKEGSQRFSRMVKSDLDRLFHDKN